MTLFLLAHLISTAQPIDRKALVQRHNVIITKADPLSSLSVGNGKFAFTVDVTGLQSFAGFYEKGIPLGTQSDWGWHSFPNHGNFRFEETLKTYHLNGKPVQYAVQWNEPGRNKDAANWFRQNPHRLQLGNIGFELMKKDGSPAQIDEIRNIRQELDLWTGEIRSRFLVEDVPVMVSTFCHSETDAIAVKAVSALLRDGRLKIKLVFPFPSGEWTDVGTNWNHPEKHKTVVLSGNSNSAEIFREIDSTKYFLSTWWKGNGVITKSRDHYLLLIPDKGQNEFAFTVRFNSNQPSAAPKDLLPAYNETKASSEAAWPAFWSTGGAIDFAGSTDERAFELERRIILSQYLMKAMEAGAYPPQETGLVYNSWFGKPHLEMHWWHAVHYALWGRIDHLEKTLDWYATVFPKAREIAKRQGWEGIRWQKMTDPSGAETPSSVGSFLIWQQPHFIYFAELCYRERKDLTLLNKYKDLVFATADGMASFAHYEKEKERYILGKGLIPAQETYNPEQTFNPVYELAYWHWALSIAQEWRERLQLSRNRKWDQVLQKLSMPAIGDNKYLFAESAVDSYTNAQLKTDHPSVLGALGMLPQTKLVDANIMKNTFDWIWQNWNWEETWGWDYPMVAMTAARLGFPEKAIDALMMKTRTNTYLVNGHNYQDERLRLYMPGNGGLLIAVAMFCAGWDGSKTKDPGIPKNGKWKIKWEGLRLMP